MRTLQINEQKMRELHRNASNGLKKLEHTEDKDFFPFPLL